jgi:hypothetical protein
MKPGNIWPWHLGQWVVGAEVSMVGDVIERRRGDVHRVTEGKFQGNQLYLLFSRLAGSVAESPIQLGERHRSSDVNRSSDAGSNENENSAFPAPWRE